MRRLHYIDNLRAVCMLLGILVHVSTLGDYGLFNTAAAFSNMFRMATFFLISGFMGVMLYQRYGVPQFLASRMRNLAIPLISSLILLNPITLLLVFRFHNGDVYPDAGGSELWQAMTGQIPHKALLVWHLHLWFLFSLIFYVLMVPLVCRPVARFTDWAANRAISRWRDGILVPLIIAVIIAGMVVVILTGLKLAGPRISNEWLIRATLMYWPYYLLGMVLFRSEYLWAVVQRINAPLLIAAVLVSVVQANLQLPEPLDGAFYQLALVLQRCAITFVLLNIFSRFLNQRGRITDLLSQSIYTVYLFHYLLIYILATLYVMIRPMDLTGAVIIAIFSGLLGIALHYYVVGRVPLLSYLFNGKKQTREHKAKRAA